MDKGQVEQSGDFLGKLMKVGSSKENTTPPSDFEQKLFRNGVYEFDFNAEIRKSECCGNY